MSRSEYAQEENERSCSSEISVGTCLVHERTWLSQTPGCRTAKISRSVFSQLVASWYLTRALEGGKKCPPLRFFADSGKTAARSPQFFQYLITIEFDTLCKNFSPRSPNVRSPGQVKVKNGFLTLRLRSGHTRYPIGVKPSAFHKVIDTYNLYISDFLYLSPEVRSIS